MAGVPALHERDEALGAALAALRPVTAGEPALVVVEGAPGLGKTALLAALRARLPEALAAHPAEHEAAHPHGVVAQLLGPGVVAALPAGPESDFGVLDALFWRVADLAPRVLVVDDAHWADPPSLRLLGHLVRRMDGLAIGLVVALRPDEPGPADLLDALRLHPRAHRIALRPLSVGATTALAGGDPALGAACHRATGGNPLYVHELLRSLALDGVAPTPAAVADATPATVARHTGRRAAALGAEAVALTEAMALLGDGTPLAHAALAAGLDAHEARRLAGRLTAMGVLAEVDPVRFRHPVVLAAVRAAVPAERRDGLLRRAVAVLTEAGAPAEAVADVLLELPPGGGAPVDALLAVAAGAASRGAPDVARTHLLRALAEPPPAAARAAVLHALGQAEQRLRLPGYAERLRAAIEAAPDAQARTAWTVELAGALSLQGETRETLALLERTYDAAWLPGPAARDLVGLLLSAVAWSDAAGHPRVRALLDAPVERDSMRAGFAAGVRAARMDLPHAQVAALGRAAVQSPADPGTFLGRMLGAGALTYADELATAGTALDGLLEEARAAGDARWIGAIHVLLADLAHATGDLGRCLVHLGLFGGPLPADPATGTFAYVAGLRIRVLLDRGDRAGAEAALAAVGPEPWLPTSHAQHFLRLAHGRLLRAQGRPADAAATLALARECLGRFAGCTWSPLGFDGAWEEPLALAEAGRRGEAEALVDDALARGRAQGPPRNLAVTLRAAAVLHRGEDGVAAAEEAVALLEGVGARLELARTLTELGRLHRQAGRRARAREPLARALDLARDCGAAPLAAQALGELEAAGARPRRERLTSGREALTPSEARMARMAADGRTNREIAQELYLSIKTVETHLGRAYRKLAVAGRGDLAAALDAP